MTATTAFANAAISSKSLQIENVQPIFQSKLTILVATASNACSHVPTVHADFPEKNWSLRMDATTLRVSNARCTIVAFVSLLDQPNFGQELRQVFLAEQSHLHIPNQTSQYFL